VRVRRPALTTEIESDRIPRTPGWDRWRRGRPRRRLPRGADLLGLLLIQRDHLATVNQPGARAVEAGASGDERGSGEGKAAGSEVSSQSIGSGRLRLIRGGIL